ncbi:hypothetical protein VIN01S_20470 [Vibrio inusitatus NBRC 102082]|uniref:Solute-binding protein family 3/N-terminal domain-containing protein n=1 Tax=Vibrio inusitatus NBRC 102082 TaxID=1219070 RepID=A0A4Y3HVM9_9VIBR|nr:hypothetical protein VIN01S_20470 [Vibrio inusitatus NBRC 102082]
MLKLALGTAKVTNDLTDYPDAKDEGNIFNLGADALVTVAGNTKFEQHAFLSVGQPLCMGLLGHRILIIRRQDVVTFSDITEENLKALKAGIPATWADADLFRSNGYQVFEQGSLDTIFADLQLGLCDYVALGANEVQAIYHEFAEQFEGLVIESSMMLYYPFPLVFYVHPQKEQLATEIKNGLELSRNNGALRVLFDKHYGQVVTDMNLRSRRQLELNNPLLPKVFSGFSSELISSK